MSLPLSQTSVWLRGAVSFRTSNRHSSPAQLSLATLARGNGSLLTAMANWRGADVALTPLGLAGGAAVAAVWEEGGCSVMVEEAAGWDWAGSQSTRTPAGVLQEIKTLVELPAKQRS